MERQRQATDLSVVVTIYETNGLLGEFAYCSIFITASMSALVVSNGAPQIAFSSLKEFCNGDSTSRATVLALRTVVRGGGSPFKISPPPGA
jgi:hypothetical protein